MGYYIHTDTAVAETRHTEREGAIERERERNRKKERNRKVGRKQETLHSGNGTPHDNKGTGWG